jgi:hypothetical protein
MFNSFSLLIASFATTPLVYNLAFFFYNIAFVSFTAAGQNMCTIKYPKDVAKASFIVDSGFTFSPLFWGIAMHFLVNP